MAQSAQHVHQGRGLQLAQAVPRTAGNVKETMYYVTVNAVLHAIQERTVHNFASRARTVRYQMDPKIVNTVIVQRQ